MLGYCFTPYQRLRQYNGAPLVAFYDTLGIRRTYSRLKPPASSWEKVSVESVEEFTDQDKIFKRCALYDVSGSNHCWNLVTTPRGFDLSFTVYPIDFTTVIQNGTVLSTSHFVDVYHFNRPFDNLLIFITSWPLVCLLIWCCVLCDLCQISFMLSSLYIRNG